ncbi:uncharacterized protein [Oscarella lobularis]|uniref:uncharacterized protein isoform X2 n=1 Tax=Oscarella lobularis TaxID=121494 RepID=UPI003313A2FA
MEVSDDIFRTEFLSNAYSDREATIGVMLTSAASAAFPAIASPANDSPWLKSSTAPVPASDLLHSEGGTNINLQTDLAPTSSPEELNSFNNPSGCGYEKNLEKDHTYADERLGILIDDVLDLECEYKFQTPAVGSQTASGPFGSILSSEPDWTVPGLSGIQTTPVQDVESRHDSGIDISQASKSEPASQETFMCLSGTPAFAPDQAAAAAWQRIAYSTPLRNGEEFIRTQYGSSWDPSPTWESFIPFTSPTSIHPTPECETDPIQRDGSDSPSCLSPPRLSDDDQAFAKWCEESGTSGKREATLRVKFIPCQIRKGNMKVEREENDVISLVVENYSGMANRWFKKKQENDPKKRDSYDFRRALKSTFKRFDNNVKVLKINYGKGRKFVFSKKFTKYKDKLKKASSSVANHEENDFPQATGGQDRVISSDTGAARGKTRRRQSRTTYTHKQSSSYKYTPRPSKEKKK